MDDATRTIWYEPRTFRNDTPSTHANTYQNSIWPVCTRWTPKAHWTDSTDSDITQTGWMGLCAALNASVYACVCVLCMWTGGVLYTNRTERYVQCNCGRKDSVRQRYSQCGFFVCLCTLGNVLVLSAARDCVFACGMADDDLLCHSLCARLCVFGHYTRKYRIWKE